VIPPAHYLARKPRRQPPPRRVTVSVQPTPEIDDERQRVAHHWLAA
jgi:hypothetical protein